MDKLFAVREYLAQKKYDAVLVTSSDEYLSEYTPECFKRLEWLTGFTGSSGLAIIFADMAVFFTDGRYLIQAGKQLSEDYKIVNISEVDPATWIRENVEVDSKIAFDPWMHTHFSIQKYRDSNVNLVEERSPIDELWDDRPALPDSKAFSHAITFAGKPFENKIRSITASLRIKGISAAIITASDSVCWLLNIRGNDVAYNPLLLSYAILFSDGSISLYTDPEKITDEIMLEFGDKVKIFKVEDLENDIAYLSGQRVLIDPKTANEWFFQKLIEADAKIVEGDDPCLLPKACKNEVEVAGSRDAHMRDGAALTKFLYWLENLTQNGEEVDEISASEKLEEFRSKNDLFKGASFSTISAFGANAAIVHYNATQETSQKISNDGIYLVDSGGQYFDGTTDVTRTVSIGAPTEEQKGKFTLVMKGHIAIASAVFPEGTRGSDLDVLARNYLWKCGLNYDHGTGHGVGSYLCVHEGPQGISKNSLAALRPGMILSNEPGFYKEGKYGIRIENLVLVVEKEEVNGIKFLGFENLTLAPIDLSLIDINLLDPAEINWINEYHDMVKEKLGYALDDLTMKWLEDKTKPLSLDPENP